MANPNAKLTITLVDKTKKGFAAISKSLGTARAAVNSTRGAVAGLAGAAGFGLLVKSSFAAIDATTKLADAIGISTEKLGGYQFLASQAGVDNEALNNSFKKLANSVGEASMNLGTAAPAFKELGIDAQALAKASPDEQFKRVADAISQVGDRSTQAALAQDIFGKKGIDLLNVLDKGRAGIEAYQKEAELLGATFTRIDAAKVEAANDAFDKLSKIFTGFFNRVAVTLSPLIIGIANDLKKVILEAGGFQSAIDKAFSFAVRAVGIFANGIRGIQIAFTLLQAGAAASLAAIAGGLGRVIGAIAEFSGNEGLARASQELKNFKSSALDTFDASIGKAQELSLSILPSEVISGKITEYKAFANTIAAENAKIAAGNAAGGDGGITEAARLEQQRINTKFEAIKASTVGELALNKQKLDAKLLQDQEFLLSAESIRINGELKTNALLESIKQQHKDKLLQIEQKSVQDILGAQIDYTQSAAGISSQLANRQQNIDQLSAAGKTQLAEGAFRETLSIAATGSKKLFEINKKLALADAVINGFKAIQAGFATSPFLPVGLAMGALAAVKTAKQIQGIKSQTFSGGGGKPSASGGGAVPSISQQQQTTPGQAPTVEGPAQRERKANIVVNGEIDTREKTLNFAKELVELTKDGFTDLEILIGAEV